MASYWQSTSLAGRLRAIRPKLIGYFIVIRSCWQHSGWKFLLGIFSSYLWLNNIPTTYPTWRCLIHPQLPSISHPVHNLLRLSALPTYPLRLSNALLLLTSPNTQKRITTFLTKNWLFLTTGGFLITLNEVCRNYISPAGHFYAICCFTDFSSYLWTFRPQKKDKQVAPRGH